MLKLSFHIITMLIAFKLLIGMSYAQTPTVKDTINQFNKRVTKTGYWEEVKDNFKYQGRYSNGKKEGVWTQSFLDTNDSRYATRIYRNDSLKQVQWFQKDNCIMSDYYINESNDTITKIEYDYPCDSNRIKKIFIYIDFIDNCSFSKKNEVNIKTELSPCHFYTTIIKEYYKNQKLKSEEISIEKQNLMFGSYYYVSGNLEYTTLRIGALPVYSGAGERGETLYGVVRSISHYEYYINGRKIIEKYDDLKEFMKPLGLQKEYFENGNIRKIIISENNKIILEDEFDETDKKLK